MRHWCSMFAVSYLVASVLAAVLLFAFPQLSTMCSSEMSWQDCNKQMNFYEIFFTPIMPAFLMFFVSVSFVLTLIWPRTLAWPQSVAIGMVCGLFAVLEYPSGILQDVDVSLEAKFGIFSSIVLYAIYFFSPYVVSLILSLVLSRVVGTT